MASPAGSPPAPSALDQTFARALALHQQGQFDDADHLYQSIIYIDARHVPSLLHLAVLRLQQGRHQDAVRLTEDALQLEPDCAEAHSNLGAALHLLSRSEEAVSSYEAALALDPDRAEAHYGLALALHAVERYDEAMAAYQRALAIDPDYAEAHCGLGAALAAVQRHVEALSCYRRALEIDPDYSEAICGLAEAFHALNRDDEAIACYRAAVAIKPDQPQVLSALGIALQATGQHGEAVDCFGRALAIAPDYGDAQLNLGIVLEELGRIDEARRALEKAVATDPENLRYIFSLVTSRQVREQDPVFAALQAWESRVDTLDVNRQVLLHFALGKALGDLGRPEQSFRHLLTGNELKRQTIAYDEVATLTALERISSVFDNELLHRNLGFGSPSPTPVFIVGMPRSGSTLVEQILASHPGVFGGGERIDFAVAAESAGIEIRSSAFPESTLGIDGGQVARLGAEYLRRLREAARSLGVGAAARITDKMPANFRFLGLIHLALPNARIIHIRRDPVDTCLSCFSELFGAEQPFAYDLGELGRYYRAYELMAHWRDVLPADVLRGAIRKASRGFRPQARRIVAHCGLDVG